MLWLLLPGPARVIGSKGLWADTEKPSAAHGVESTRQTRMGGIWKGPTSPAVSWWPDSHSLSRRQSTANISEVKDEPGRIEQVYVAQKVSKLKLFSP